jgi:hypothetical protein
MYDVQWGKSKQKSLRPFIDLSLYVPSTGPACRLKLSLWLEKTFPS